jgi:hypothetical protein
VVLRGAEGQRRRAVAQAEEARLLAVEKFLDHDLRARAAEGAIETGVDRSERLPDSVIATVTPLPAASPSALTTIGAPASST